jgi:hypothetical protein
MDMTTVSPGRTTVTKTQSFPRKTVRTSLHAAMNRFYDRDDTKLKFGTRKDYEHTLMLLEEYVNSFGSVMLRAAGFKQTLAKPLNGPVSKRYDPASLAPFFRSFVLFFLQFKVNAPQEIKETFIRIIEEFIVWLRQTGHLPKDFNISLEAIDSPSADRAIRAATVLSKAVAHSEPSRRKIEDIHDGEPLYMVSRVKSGRLWFIYYAAGGYDEFGPVSVPLGVSDVVNPGWLIDCAFGKYDGRWQIKSVRGILPI